MFKLVKNFKTGHIYWNQNPNHHNRQITWANYVFLNGIPSNIVWGTERLNFYLENIFDDGWEAVNGPGVRETRFWQPYAEIQDVSEENCPGVVEAINAIIRAVEQMD